jgi:hypothetical protein
VNEKKERIVAQTTTVWQTRSRFYVRMDSWMDVVIIFDACIS